MISYREADLLPALDRHTKTFFRQIFASTSKPYQLWVEDEDEHSIFLRSESTTDPLALEKNHWLLFRRPGWVLGMSKGPGPLLTSKDCYLHKPEAGHDRFYLGRIQKINGDGTVSFIKSALIVDPIHMQNISTDEREVVLQSIS